jgi:predicted glycosyltransferase
MNNPAPFNILMYSHDTYGLGHIRRSMAIASHLCDDETNILILTGSPIAGRFAFPKQMDFIRIPGMIKQKDGDYQSLSIRIGQEQALAIRTSLILAAAQSFRPDIFIVDKEPHGLKKEVLPTLEWLRMESPQTTSILGLRDILDDAEVVRNDWLERGIYPTLNTLYDEVWVYGEQDIYDAKEQYGIPDEINNKLFFTGYIPRAKLQAEIRKKVRKKYRILKEDIFVLVTTGGGGDGAEMIDHYLDMHDYYPTSLPFKSLIVTGPFMPHELREQARQRAKKHGIKMIPFHPRVEGLMKAADLVISMGGYNTICELLTYGTPSLIIPRETPRREQLIRAGCLKERKLLDFIRWNEVTPQLLREKIMSILDNREQYVKSIGNFNLSGLATIRQRVTHLKNCCRHR